jgi:hypothetical protein
MRILLDADAPIQMLAVLQHLLPTHRVDHVHDLGWSSKKDLPLLRDATSAGYQVFVTNDANQFEDAAETAAIRRSRLHHVRYGHRQPGLQGLGLAIGAVVSAMPAVIASRERGHAAVDPGERTQPKSEAALRQHRPRSQTSKILELTAAAAGDSNPSLDPELAITGE